MAGKADIRTTTLITGILTALVIVVSQLFYFETTAHSKKEIKTEQQEDSNQGTYISLPSSTLPSSTQVEFHQETFCLFEILFEEQEEESYDFSVSLPRSKFFRTLFQAIISPNAP